MRQPEVTGERELTLTEVPDPEPTGEWAKVRVDAAPMCTEYKQWLDGDRGPIRGHEAAGEVVAVDGASGVEPGDRVVATPLFGCGRCRACRAGDVLRCTDEMDFAAATGQESGDATYARYLLKPAHLLLDVPDGLSTTHASMACCGLGPTFQACERAGVDGTDAVLISGAGPVGLGGLINATHRGARVVISEPAARRADLARDFGADAVIDPTEESAAAELDALTDGRGVDAALECTGVTEARRFALDALRDRGALAVIGEGGTFEVDGSADLIHTGVEIFGVWHYDLGHAPAVFDAVAANEARVDRLITHEFPLEAVERAFELQAERRTGKVVLHPGE
jgi:L-iditol 2-dehydrogenase